MRIMAMAVLSAASILASPYSDMYYLGNAGPGALLLWPTARSTALAGAMSGLADEADAAFFNPAGLAFQTTAKANLSYGNWLPGLYPGMYYAYVAGGAPLSFPFLHGRNAYLAGSLTYMVDGETDIVNERGEYLGRVTTWRGAAGLQLAMLATERLGVGIGLKVLRDSRDQWNWFWERPYSIGKGAAADISLLYRPIAPISIGATLANLGPHIIYRPSGEDEDLPRMARLGVCWTPVESREVRVRVMPELDKLLVGMFRDTTGRKPLGRQLQEEWRGVWKALALEVTAFRLVSLRMGYFEDVTGQRGGVVLENADGETYHYSLWDALSRKGLGQLKSIGLCWGLGFGSDVIRLDLSSDAAIYDFPTQNWKLQLTCNDIGRLLGVRS